jgi:hypothetical protein
MQELDFESKKTLEHSQHSTCKRGVAYVCHLCGVTIQIVGIAAFEEEDKHIHMDRFLLIGFNFFY